MIFIVVFEKKIHNEILTTEDNEVILFFYIILANSYCFNIENWIISSFLSKYETFHLLMN